MSTTHPTEAERDAAAWRLVNAQIKLAERQERWETGKALATIILAIVATAGAIVAVSGFIRSSPQQITATIHLDAPLVIAPAKP
jgi:hypothetical protein